MRMEFGFSKRPHSISFASELELLRALRLGEAYLCYAALVEA